MRRYHDVEWGVPIVEDDAMFERICLEAFQCGLSWSTILARRERLREVFCGFDIEVVARFSTTDVDRLVSDPSIIRHRGKIEAVVTNARACQRLHQEVGSLADHLWSFAPSATMLPRNDNVPSTSPASHRLSKDLKSRGWSFVGPTTMYALMQAVGMVNDHDLGCPRYGVIVSMVDDRIVGRVDTSGIRTN